jgi:ribosome assembly protein 4
VASGSADKTVKIWDCETGKELYTFEGHGEWIRCLAFGPAG